MGRTDCVAAVHAIAPRYDSGMTSPDLSDSNANSRPPGSRRAKVAVTLPDPLLARARERVRARAIPSLSALVTEALEEKLERDCLQEVLDQMAAECGPLTPEDLAWADRLLEG